MGRRAGDGTQEPEALSPEQAWPLVQEAILAFNAKVPDMAQARTALTRVLRARAWACYASPLGPVCQPRDFAEWVTAAPPQGLKTTVKNLQQIARGDPALTDALDEALKMESRPGDRSDLDDNIIKVGRPDGTAQAQALRRLRTQRPDLHARVLLPKGDEGCLSAHAAMVEAGFRPKTVAIPVARPERVAAYLRRHMSREGLLRLIEILSQTGDPDAD